MENANTPRSPPSSHGGEPFSPPKSAHKTPTKSPRPADRFIPTRSPIGELGHFKLVNETAFNETHSSESFKYAIADCLFEGNHSGNILNFASSSSSSQSADSAFSSPGHKLPLAPRRSPLTGLQKVPESLKHFRTVPLSPERLLDAPNIIDDYYLNLMDWGLNNSLAVALGSQLYLWNSDTAEVTNLLQTEEEENYVCSVSWCPTSPNLIAVGTADHEIRVVDAETQKVVRSFGRHAGRVGCLSWNPVTNGLLTSGSKDATIMHHDIRDRHEHYQSLRGHTQEVCGLQWAQDGTQLASGGNDNVLCIWDASATSTQPRFMLKKHTAAVKAVAWCPWQPNLLASGGGTADRMLRFWNSTTGQCTESIDTKSQVCAIQWSRHDRELITSHGFSENQLILWSFPSMAKIAELTGHNSRVLHLTQSPDGQTVVSAAGDETIRFWRVFSTPEIREAKAREDKKKPSQVLRPMILR